MVHRPRCARPVRHDLAIEPCWRKRKLCPNSLPVPFHPNFRLISLLIRHNLTYEIRLTFYNCLILSRMGYCCVVWGNTSKENLDRIHRLQKKAARLILDRESKAPSLPLFQPNSDGFQFMIELNLCVLLLSSKL